MTLRCRTAIIPVDCALIHNLLRENSPFQQASTLVRFTAMRKIYRPQILAGKASSK